MREAVIVDKAYLPGSPNTIVGRETLNPFKKTRAYTLRENLRKAIQEEQIAFTVDFDISSGDIREIQLDGIDLCIFTPFIVDYVELDLLEDNDYIVLTPEEYDAGDVSRIVNRMKWMDYL